VVVAFFTSFVWAEWQGAIPIDQAPAWVAVSLPQGCPAVSVNHGVYSCFSEGTVNSNLLGYAVCTAIFVLSGGTALVIGLMGKGLYQLRVALAARLGFK
jgi:hypothetical protein